MKKIAPEESYTYSIKFSIKYQTSPGQNIYIFGSIKELGNWKENKFKLKWSEGHIWKGVLELPEHIDFFDFKFVCLSDDNTFKRWEEGPNRLFDKRKITDTTNIYKVDCIWDHFTIAFHIFYPLNNETEYLQIIGEPTEIGGWFKNGGLPLKMRLTEPMTLGSVTGKFWHAVVNLPSFNFKNFNFEYRYSIYNPIKSN